MLCLCVGDVVSLCCDVCVSVLVMFVSLCVVMLCLCVGDVVSLCGDVVSLCW